jgi:hypothetical protein
MAIKQNSRSNNLSGAHFPKFVLHLRAHLSRTSESYGRWQIYNSGAAFLFEVPGSNSPLAVQELQIGGTSASVRALSA